MSVTFSQAMAFVLRWEGGMVDDPNDPGGLTNHGISQRAYPDLDIASLTREGVIEIYRRDYWDRARCGEMPAPLALVVFDSAVNQGVTQSVRCLQRAAGASVDGVIGPATMESAIRAWQRRPERLLRDVCLQRLLHYSAIGGWVHYRVGWSKRLLDCLQVATQMLAR
jgi:lysozyme family protein